MRQLEKQTWVSPASDRWLNRKCVFEAVKRALRREPLSKMSGPQAEPLRTPGTDGWVESRLEKGWARVGGASLERPKSPQPTAERTLGRSGSHVQLHGEASGRRVLSR